MYSRLHRTPPRRKAGTDQAGEELRATWRIVRALAGRDGLFADELVVKEQPKNVENRPIDVDSR